MEMRRRQFALSIAAASSMRSSLFEATLSPLGVPRGVIPGRVTWVHDPSAVTRDGTGSWWTDANNNQTVLDRMVSRSIRGLADQKSDAQAWSAIFHYFNRTRGRQQGYQAGEKIAIKANLNDTVDHGTIERLNSSPHLILSLVRQLAGPGKVQQSSITIFDSSRFIPGNLYDNDLGGEGVAYHDTDPKNHGSGELKTADGTYLNEFRIHERVDTSYTKFDHKPDPIDDNSFDKVVPPRDLPYVGWTEPGEWFNITVNAAHEGAYAADFLYTSNRGGTISIDVNGKDAMGPLKIASTYDPAYPVACRQCHHWNLASNFIKIRLGKGRNVLTVHILTGGNMNLAYFDFKQDR